MALEPIPDTRDNNRDKPRDLAATVDFIGFRVVNLIEHTYD